MRGLTAYPQFEYTQLSCWGILIWMFLGICPIDLHGQDPLAKDLVAAVEQGDLDQVRALKKAGVDIHESIPSQSAFYLFFLSREMYLDALEGRLRHKPVYIAAIHANAARADEKMLKLLLRYKANIDAGDSEGKSPLMYALKNPGGESYAMRLVKKGANYTCSDLSGNTAIHYAAFGGNIQGIVLAQTGGIDINAPNSQGITPIHAAAVYGDTTLLQAMLDLGADLHTRDGSGFNLLHYAAGFGHVPKLNWILSAAPDLMEVSQDGYTPMDIAFRARNDSAVEFLKSKGGQFHKQWHSELLHALVNKKFDEVDHLLRMGAFPNRTSPEEPHSPLHLAVAMQDLVSVGLLLRAGADPNDLNEKGKSPMDLAILSGNAEMVNMLVQIPNAKIKSAHLFQVLTYMTGKELAGRWQDVAIRMVEKLPSGRLTGGSLNVPALHHAAYVGNLKLVKTLLSRGADALETDSDGWSALHWCMMRQDALPRHPEKLAIAQLLLNPSSPPNTSIKAKKVPSTTGSGFIRIPAHASALDVLFYNEPREQDMVDFAINNGLKAILGLDDRLENASYCLKFGDAKQALNELARAREISPEHAQTWFFMGEAHHLLEDYKTAEQCFSKAIKLAGNQPQIHLARAKCRLDSGHYSGAFSDIEEVMKTETWKSEALYWRGHLHLKMNQKAKACHDFEASKNQGYTLANEAIETSCL